MYVIHLNTQCNYCNGISKDACKVRSYIGPALKFSLIILNYVHE